MPGAAPGLLLSKYVGIFNVTKSKKVIFYYVSHSLNSLDMQHDYIQQIEKITIDIFVDHRKKRFNLGIPCFY